MRKERSDASAVMVVKAVGSGSPDRKEGRERAKQRCVKNNERRF